MRTAIRIFFAFLLASIQADAAAILGSTRTYDWGKVGINGGIPVVSTVYTNLVPSGGNDYLNIRQGLLNCPSNQVVVLGAGRYFWTNMFDFNDYANGVVLRGTKSNGTNASVLRWDGGATRGFYLRRAYSPTRIDDQAMLSANAVKGQKTVTVTSVPSWLTVGNLYLLDQLDDHSFVQDGSTNIWENGDDFRFAFVTEALGHRGLSQLILVTNISGTTISLDRELGYGFSTAQSASISGALYDPDTAKPLMRSGIEDFTIEGNFTGASADTVYFESALNCWARGIEVNTNIGLVAFKTIASYGIEIRDNWVHEEKLSGGGQGYGIGIFYSSWHVLVQNNRVKNQHVSIQISYGSGGNVIAYNLCAPGASSSTSVTSWDAHGTGSYMNLVEGNFLAAQGQGDVVHGSSSHNVIFRNRIVGTNIYGNDETCIETDYYSRFYSVVGNILGQAGKHTIFEKIAPSSCVTGSDKVIRKVGYKNPFGCDTTCEGDGGNCYDDLATSQLQWSVNYDVVTSTNSGLVLGGFALSDLTNSYFLTVKPAEFGILPWPPYSPGAPGFNDPTNIPAGFYDKNGYYPPADGTVYSNPRLKKNGLKITR